MANVNATVTMGPQTFAGGTVGGSGLYFRLNKIGATTNPVATATVQLPATTATFLNVADGDYTVSVNRLTPTNQNLHNPVTSAQFNVNSQVTIDVVIGVTAGEAP